MLRNYVVVDIETTGLSRYYHRITEIAAVKVKNNRIVEEFQQLVNPETKIPSFITNLTGISNAMVKDKPNIKQVLPIFLEFMDKNIMIAHNASFDHGFLSVNTENHLDKDFMNTRICTRKLAYRILNNLPSRRLSALCEYYQIDNNQAHRALSDAKATQRIFDIFNRTLHKKGVKTKKDILEFESSSLRELMKNDLL